MTLRTPSTEALLMLEYPHSDALRARIRLSHTLLPMALEETIRYIDHDLAIETEVELFVVMPRRIRQAEIGNYRWQVRKKSLAGNST